MIRVKVCGLTEPMNAREIAQADANYIGFIFYKGSKRYVGDNPDSDLFLHFPEDVRKVGVFVNENVNRIVASAERFGLHTIQLHGAETAGFCRTLKNAGFEVIKAFGLGVNFDFNRLIPYGKACDYFLFDTQTKHFGGSGVKFRWEILKNYDMDKPFFLSGGIGPDDLQNIRGFNHSAFYGADINSRFELAPGIKDSAMVRKFIKDINTSSL